MVQLLKIKMSETFRLLITKQTRLIGADGFGSLAMEGLKRQSCKYFRYNTVDDTNPALPIIRNIP